MRAIDLAAALGLRPRVRCFECGAPADHDHHVIPRVLGGTKTVPLCERHHGMVHDRSMVGHVRLTVLGKRLAKERGVFTGGARPYGSQVVDGRVVADEGEAAVVAQARALRSAGLSLRAVSATLAERGVLSRRGTAFLPAQVARMVA